MPSGTIRISCAFVTVALAANCQWAGAEEFRGSWEEPLVQPAVASLESSVFLDETPVRGCSSFECGGCRSCGDCGGDRGYFDGLDYALNFRGGSSFFDAPGESLWGGTYGLDVAANLYEDWTFLGTVNAGHFSGGSQLAASLGLVKPDNLDCCDPYSFSVVFDQFTDSRIDGLYLSQLRLQTGYSFSENLEVGALYTTPTNRDTDVSYTFTFLGTDFTELGTASQSESISGYIAGRLARGVQYGFVAGARREPDTFLAAASLRAPITDRIGVFAGGSYMERFASWGVGIGVEFTLGPGGRRCAGVCGSGDYATSNAGRAGVQAVSYVPPNIEFPDPPVGVEVPYDGLTTDGPLVSEADGSRAQRVLRSNHKTIHDLFSQPTMMWGGCSGDPDRNPFFRDKANVEAFNVRYGQPGKSERLFLGTAQ